MNDKYKSILADMAQVISDLESQIISGFDGDDCTQCYTDGIEVAKYAFDDVYDALKKAITDDEIADIMSNHIVASPEQKKLL